MDPKDKYTVFSPHHRGYRKGIHKLPKWTRVRPLAPPYIIIALICLPSVDHTKNKPERLLTTILPSVDTTFRCKYNLIAGI